MGYWVWGATPRLGKIAMGWQMGERIHKALKLNVPEGSSRTAELLAVDGVYLPTNAPS